MSKSEESTKVGVRDMLAAARDGRRLVTVTAYDACMARLADESGVDMILVGDSMGMTMLGYDTTVPVTLDDIVRHTAAVVRGVKRAMVIADMPFLSCRISEEEALRNCGRVMQETGADGVKLEGGETMAPTVRRLVDCGIPVLGHVGLLPQQVKTAGGFRVHGRSPEQARQLKRDARLIQEAGAFGIVLEAIPMDLAAAITEELRIPTIGIGAGAHCTGQIQVIHDILGLFEAFVPRHTKRYACLAETIRGALSAYGDDVREGLFPGEEHAFR